MPLSEHLFRRESGRMVSALTRIFGIRNIDLAEDVVQDAFCKAVEVWKFRGIPENPSAWLMAAAKNRAIDVLRRERTARTFAPEFGRLIQSEWTLAPTVEHLFSDDAIKDDLLRMMFTCCHPRLPPQSQISLILQVLCGFSVVEVANAFLTAPAATEKRLWRAKKTLAEAITLFDVLDEQQITARRPTVQHAVYLLFNEGYHGASGTTAIRTELCREAIRLGAVLLANPLVASPSGYAMQSLMCLNAARLPGRIGTDGNLTTLQYQNRSLWDQNFIDQGLALLDTSAQGTELSEYHVEAALAAVHVRAERTEDTDWAEIVALYDLLYTIKPTPVVALNRAVAIGQRDGPERGLIELHAISGRDRLSRYPFYFAALGEFELRGKNWSSAAEYYRQASSLARNDMERQFYQARALGCCPPAETFRS
jgi:RNA polymerase sigma factor (sigma-70 family)